VAGRRKGTESSKKFRDERAAGTRDGQVHFSGLQRLANQSLPFLIQASSLSPDNPRPGVIARHSVVAAFFAPPRWRIHGNAPYLGRPLGDFSDSVEGFSELPSYTDVSI